MLETLDYLEKLDIEIGFMESLITVVVVLIFLTIPGNFHHSYCSKYFNSKL
jgi:hypothetical protein